jgi:small subunit ribosomal protein S15
MYVRQQNNATTASQSETCCEYEVLIEKVPIRRNVQKMFSRLLYHSNQKYGMTAVARHGGSNIPAVVSFVSTLFSNNPNNSSINDTTHTQLQQYRSRWTKAKKKRTARFTYRKELKAKGIELPKPPYYFPKNTPVTNAVTSQERAVQIQQHDIVVTAELQKKLEITNQKPLLRHHMSGLQMSDRVRKLFDLHNGNQQEVVQAQKQRGMELFQLRPGDTGSSAVQVIALTTRIQQLQTHMTTHKKDKHSKKGMDALYIRRRKTLDYMERKDFDSYRRVVKTLGLNR